MITGGKFKLAMVLACALMVNGCENQTELEAHSFLSAYQRLLDASPSKRADEVSKLEALPLTTKAIKKAQGTCVQMHRALIDSEEATTAQLKVNPDKNSIEEQRKTVEQVSQLLLNVERLQPQCAAAVRNLRSKYPTE